MSEEAICRLFRPNPYDCLACRRVRQTFVATSHRFRAPTCAKLIAGSPHVDRKYDTGARSSPKRRVAVVASQIPMDTDEAYDVLELSPPVSDETIKEAFRTLTKKYHPDVSEGDTREHWMRINTAKETLLSQNRSSRSGTSGDDTTARQTTRTATAGATETDKTTENERTCGRDHRRRRGRARTEETAADSETEGADDPVSGIRAVLAPGETGIKKLGWLLLLPVAFTNMAPWFLQLPIVGGVAVFSPLAGISYTISLLVVGVFFSFGGAFMFTLATAGAVLEGEYVVAGVFGLVSLLLAGFYGFTRWATA